MEKIELIPERLVLTGGVHTLDIYCRDSFNGKKEVIIRCEDDNSCTTDINGDWVQEYDIATYHLSVSDIDMIIDKLKECRKYLTKATQ